MLPDSATQTRQIATRVAHFPLLDALLRRRSRRFAPGMQLTGGPLSYASTATPRPLSVDEEAALVFAACGITGYALAELPFAAPNDSRIGSGNIMTHFVGRTVPSGDAIHTSILFVINDHGAWMIKRPQDYPRGEVADLIGAARDHRLVELYERGRVQIADRRLDVPRQIPFVPDFNHWSANVPGTTYFVPVHDMTALYINVLLAAFSEQNAYTIIDERHRFRPAGIAKFLKSRGGHLVDDPRAGRLATVGFVETWLCEFTAWEEGAMLQNQALMTEALGLGGFPHFAAYPYVWMQTLGFRMVDVPLAHTIGAGPITRRVMRALGRDLPIPTAVGLEHDGKVLIKPFCPPYYRTMAEAVLAFVDYKYAEGRGTLRDGGAATAWRDGATVQAGIPRYSDRAIDATIAYCDYIYGCYGRFPAVGGPFRTVLAFQAHHLDSGFYDRFYRPEAVSMSQRGNDSSEQGKAASG